MTKGFQMLIGQLDYSGLLFGDWDGNWPHVTNTNRTWPKLVDYTKLAHKYFAGYSDNNCPRVTENSTIIWPAQEKYFDGRFWDKFNPCPNATVDENTWTYQRNLTAEEYFAHYNTISTNMGYMVFMAFIFLCVIVLMNLLNAIAIGDIQELRANSVAETNILKIMTLLDQDPQITDCCYIFDNVNKPEQKFKKLWTYLWKSREVGKYRPLFS